MQELALKIPRYGGITPPPNIPGGTGAGPSNIINFGLAILVTIGVIAALIFILYGGILWITSQGDKGKIDRARRTITFAIIGLIVIILSFTIVRIVGYLLGASVLTNLGR